MSRDRPADSPSVRLDITLKLFNQFFFSILAMLVGTIDKRVVFIRPAGRLEWQQF